jgi:spermidine/putrescine transport system ATP-binding protein
MTDIDAPAAGGRPVASAAGTGPGAGPPGDMVPAIELTDVAKEFQARGELVAAVRGIDLAIRQGEFFSMLGPSGCGKTTTMRMIAGFEEPTRGTVSLQGRDVTWEPPNKRDVNMVFQSYALFPHMNVFENVAFGLRRRSVSKDQITRQVGEMLEIVDLTGREQRRPRELSGGQQQRVALARALVNHPKALLLDEPLGALDLKLRQAMQVELKRIQREVGITFVYVTHDQNEALTMSDRIAVMNDGLIEHLGSPREIYEHPATRFVAGFIGTSNLLTGRVSRVADGTAVIEVSPDERIVVPVGHRACGQGDEIELTVRPEKIALSAAQPMSAGCALRGTVTEVVYLGTSTNFNITTSTGADVVVFVQNAAATDDAAADVHRGDAVWLAWEPQYSYAIGSSL